MAINLTPRYLAEIAKRQNKPNVIVELLLDSGTVKWGYKSAGFSDVRPIIKSVSSFQNKLDTKTGWTTRGQINITIAGRDNFKTLIKDNYLKNRRVNKKEGFIADGFAYSDYAQTYTGIITDWSRKGDELTLVISDDFVETSKIIPVENTKGTQSLDYRFTNPLNVMQNILDTQLGISTNYIDIAKFASERDAWRNGWYYNRVITEPKEAIEYLNELQEETATFIIFDGEKITCKVFAPPLITEAIEKWSDADILIDSFTQKSGYKDNFYNRCVFYFDYDESGGTDADNFDSVIIVVDSLSQGSSQWDDVSTKTIKSKWIRSYRYTYTTAITGMVIYHASKNNGAGAGTITFTYDATNGNTLQWTPPGGTIGTAVKITESGKFDIYGSDTTKYIRVTIDTSLTPASNQTATVTLTAITGETYATSIAQNIVSRYRNPATSVAFDVDINRGVWGGVYIKPTDYKNVTTDEACEKDDDGWVNEQLMLTSVRPDLETGRIAIEAIETKFYLQYAIVAPNGYPDWGSASEAQRAYAYVGHCNAY